MSDEDLDYTENDLAKLADWIADCHNRGWQVPQDLISQPEQHLREHGPPAHCLSCGVPVLDAEFWDEGSQIPRGLPTCDDERLCDKCRDGEPGHQEYHRSIEIERLHNRQDVHRRPQDEQQTVRESLERTADEEHLACPWAARGEPCEKVDQLKKMPEE